MGTIKKQRNTEACLLSQATDFVTILMTCPGYTASKRFVSTVDGVVKHDYNAGLLFKVFEPMPVGNITDLSELLTALESWSSCLVIRGAPRDAGYIGKWVRRKGSGMEGNFHTPPDGRHWVLIDFDKIVIPKRLSLKKSPVAAREYLVKLLPAEFHDATYHWSLSSSAGMGDPTKVSMHLWFWLLSPTPDSVLKAWAKDVNQRAGLKLVDPALFQHVQAHYTAAPIFEGLPDPFPVRSGFEVKSQPFVDLKLPPASAGISTRSTRSAEPANGGATSGGSGFEYHLSLIGDQAGGEGFHSPIVSAVASYVATNGTDGTDIEALYDLVRAAVLAADASRHDAAYIEHMASRAHIVSAIESALKKFGAQPVGRRKAKLHTGIQPHFKAQPVSVAEAQRQIAALAQLFG